MAFAAREKRRVDVRLTSAASEDELRELGAFVRFCVGRIERELGIIERWLVSIAPARDGCFVSTVTTTRGDRLVEASGTARDGTLAAWIALGNISHHLRELGTQVRVTTAL
jgi:hypothetical protein